MLAPEAMSTADRSPVEPNRLSEIQRYCIRCTLLEDAHPGSGTAGAGIDALVSRDRDGGYVIWREHLEGLLLDEARHLALDTSTITRLFGTRGNRRQRALFTSLYASATMAARVWRASARTSFSNRAPKDDTLRATEYVPSGTTFEGHVELEHSDEVTLRRLLLHVEAVGGGRNRGAGRVEFELEPAVAPEFDPVAGTGDTLRLLLSNIDPLCIAATSVPGNLIPTEPFLPGQTLWGALIQWLIEQNESQVAARLVEGLVSMSNSFPLPPEALVGVADLSQVDVLPAPLSLRRAKPSPQAGATPWWSSPAEEVQRVDSEQIEGGDWKRPEPDLVVYRLDPQNVWRTCRPDIRVRLRNGRPAPNQEKDAELFSIEQISERSCWITDIVGSEDDLDTLQRALTPLLQRTRWLRVGRGGTPVEVLRAQRMSRPKPLDDSAALNKAYLVFTGDLLARDEHLRWLTTLTPEMLPTVLGWPSDVPASAVKIVAQEPVVVRGFNGTARLPRLPAAGIRRGSVLRIKGSEHVRRFADLAAGAARLGERGHLGFGQFRLDAALPGVSVSSHVEPNATASVRHQSVGPVVRPDAPEERIAEQTKRWKGEYSKAVERARPQRAPSGSQWRSLLADLCASAGGEHALMERLDVETRGAAPWKHPAAVNLLRKLKAIDAPARATHAGFFVRWLETEGREKQ